MGLCRNPVFAAQFCCEPRTAIKYNTYFALTGVAQLVGHHPAKQKVAGLSPSQGIRLGCEFGSWSVGVHARGNQ